MELPYLNEIPQSREMISTFLGYNHNLRIGDGEFYDMKNLTSSDFPVLSPRQRRGIYAVPEKPNGLIAKEKLCYVDGRYIVIGDQKIDLNLTDGEKNLVSMGAYILIFPDQKYINTVDTKDSGSMERETVISGVDIYPTYSLGINVYLTDKDFNRLNEDNGYTVFFSTGSIYPDNTPTDISFKDGKTIWVNTSTTPWKILCYHSTINALFYWGSFEYHVEINSLYGTIPNFPTGATIRLEDGEYAGISNDETGISELYGTFEIAKSTNKSLYLKCLTGSWAINATEARATSFKTYEQIPIMDYVIESNNRLWGCRYGLDNQGNMVNEIRASALGDFKSWYCFEGVSTDSYVVSVGSDGPFTGAVTYLGCPTFFKENHVHKVYGNYPANYQVQATALRGVQPGSHKSLTIMNEVLYYKSRNAICAYEGSLPVEISLPLGEESYHTASGGFLGNKYYISMCDSKGLWHLFVYDSTKKLWHREDDAQATNFCNHGGDMYFIDYADNQIKSVKGTGVPEPSRVKWEAVTGIMGVDSPDKKYISRLDVRMSLEAGSRVSFFIEYDSCGAFSHLFTMDGINLRTFSIPIRPKRCDHMRLKIIGEGEAKIFSICKTIEEGSET